MDDNEPKLMIVPVVVWKGSLVQEYHSGLYEARTIHEAFGLAVAHLSNTYPVSDGHTFMPKPITILSGEVKVGASTYRIERVTE